MIRQHDLAQPFTLPADPHQHAGDDVQEHRFAHSARDVTLLGLGGILTGQLIGWALDASGILAAIGIG